MRLIDKIAAMLLAVLGIVHSSFIGVYVHEQHREPIDGAWFLGSGIAIIVVGMLNGLRISRPKDALIRIASIMGNILALIFCLGVLHALHEHLSQAPQAIAVAALVVVELAFSAVPSK